MLKELLKQLKIGWYKMISSHCAAKMAHFLEWNEISETRALIVSDDFRKFNRNYNNAKFKLMEIRNSD